jgi:hypothetical protein
VSRQYLRSVQLALLSGKLMQRRFPINTRQSSDVRSRRFEPDVWIGFLGRQMIDWESLDATARFSTNSRTLASEIGKSTPPRIVARI